MRVPFKKRECKSLAVLASPIMTAMLLGVPTEHIYSPVILDGQRGSALRQWQSGHHLMSHALFLAVGGGCVVTIDDVSHKLKPGETILVQPGSHLQWTLPKGSGFELILFDACWRPRRTLHGAAFCPVDLSPELPLAELWGTDLPLYWPSDLAEFAATELRAMGDLWWRDTIERQLADARLALLLARLRAVLRQPVSHQADPLSDR